VYRILALLSGRWSGKLWMSKGTDDSDYRPKQKIVTNRENSRQDSTKGTNI